MFSPAGRNEVLRSQHTKDVYTNTKVKLGYAETCVSTTPSADEPLTRELDQKSNATRVQIIEVRESFYGMYLPYEHQNTTSPKHKF